jgi:hypothetical protein
MRFAIRPIERKNNLEKEFSHSLAILRSLGILESDGGIASVKRTLGAQRQVESNAYSCISLSYILLNVSIV